MTVLAFGSVNVPGRLTAGDILLPDGTTTVSAALSQKADAKLPTIYPFPAAEGIASLGMGYYKTQENIVYIQTALQKTEGYFADWTTLGVMPEGCRSSSNQMFLGLAYGEDGGYLGPVPIYYDATTGNAAKTLDGVPIGAVTIWVSINYPATR